MKTTLLLFLSASLLHAGEALDAPGPDYRRMTDMTAQASGAAERYYTVDVTPEWKLRLDTSDAGKDQRQNSAALLRVPNLFE